MPAPIKNAYPVAMKPDCQPPACRDATRPECPPSKHCFNLMKDHEGMKILVCAKCGHVKPALKQGKFNTRVGKSEGQRAWKQSR